MTTVSDSCYVTPVSGGAVPCAPSPGRRSRLGATAVRAGTGCRLHVFALRGMAARGRARARGAYAGAVVGTALAAFDA